MAAVRFRGQPLQDRQREAGGLPGAGLRGAEEVAAGKDDGDGLRLDGGGLGIALLGYGARKRGRKAEAFERIADDNLLGSAWRRVAPSTGSG
jgi:hypothetical protein